MDVSIVGLLALVPSARTFNRAEEERYYRAHAPARRTAFLWKLPRTGLWPRDDGASP